MPHSEDKFTRGERIRLEALARVQGMNPIRYDEWPQMQRMAETVKKWLKQAVEDMH